VNGLTVIEVIEIVLTATFWVFVVSVLVQRSEAGTVIRDETGHLRSYVAVAIIAAVIATLALIVGLLDRA
jgi:hypothetical protein